MYRTFTENLSKVTIYASELAAIIGENKYVPVEEAVKKVWKRIDPSGYSEALKRNLQQDLSELSTEQKEQLLKLQGVSGSSIELEDAIKKNIQGVVVDQRILKEMKSFVQTETGKSLENSSIDDFAKETSQNVLFRNDKLFVKEVIPGLTICGKIDGITDTGKIIEMKNRMYRLFKEIPNYEQIQGLAYMFLTGFNEITFIQNFKGKQAIDVLKFDQDRWNDIENHLNIFYRNFNYMRRSESFQNALIMEEGDFYAELCEGCIYEFSSQKDHQCLGY